MLRFCLTYLGRHMTSYLPRKYLIKRQPHHRVAWDNDRPVIAASNKETVTGSFVVAYPLHITGSVGDAETSRLIKDRSSNINAGRS